MRCKLTGEAWPVRRVYKYSKNLQRDQGVLSAERELKTNSARGHADDINKKSLRLGELKNVLERRKREEGALEELRQTLSSLQTEFKVSPVYLLSQGLTQTPVS